jgi:hypothetical protein
LRDQAPLDILRRAREEVRVGHEVAEIHRLWGLAAFLPTALREYMGLESAVRLTGKDAALQLNADFSRESALVLMPNPDTFGKTVLLVTGATGGKLADDMSSLVQFLPWGSLKGDVAVWRSDRSLDNMVRTAKITDEHATASASFAQIVGLKISQHPWWALLGAILLIFVFGLITHFALVKYQRRLFKKRNQS